MHIHSTVLTLIWQSFMRNDLHIWIRRLSPSSPDKFCLADISSSMALLFCLIFLSQNEKLPDSIYLKSNKILSIKLNFPKVMKITRFYYLPENFTCCDLNLPVMSSYGDSLKYSGYCHIFQLVRMMKNL